jgi:hypothetical protein
VYAAQVSIVFPKRFRSIIFGQRLIIDVFDTATGGMVWHGAARVVIDPTAIDDALLERATTAILATFPARASAR